MSDFIDNLDKIIPNMGYFVIPWSFALLSISLFQVYKHFNVHHGNSTLPLYLIYFNVSLVGAMMLTGTVNIAQQLMHILVTLSWMGLYHLFVSTPSGGIFSKIFSIEWLSVFLAFSSLLLRGVCISKYSYQINSWRYNLISISSFILFTLIRAYIIEAATWESPTRLEGLRYINNNEKDTGVFLYIFIGLIIHLGANRMLYALDIEERNFEKAREIVLNKKDDDVDRTDVPEDSVEIDTDTAIRMVDGVDNSSNNENSGMHRRKKG